MQRAPSLLRPCAGAKYESERLAESPDDARPAEAERLARELVLDRRRDPVPLLGQERIDVGARRSRRHRHEHLAAADVEAQAPLARVLANRDLDWAARRRQQPRFASTSHGAGR